MAAKNDDQDSRTEDPTERRKDDARDKGQVAYSREVGSTLGLMGQFFLLFVMGGWFFSAVTEMMRSQIMGARPWMFGGVPFHSVMMPALKPIGVVMLLFLLGALIGPIIAHVVQKGFEPKPDAAMPEFSHVDPVAGTRRLFSKETLMTFLRNVVRTTGLMFVAYYSIEPHTERIVYAAALPFMEALRVYSGVFATLFLNSLLFLVAVAAIDFFLQWRMWFKGLMMTRQELKDEMKDLEGNPQIKQQVRKIQQERSKRKIERQVPQSTVVITNPTHFAIALKYSKDKTPVPRVVAKGTDFLAQKIKEIARQNHVPIVENPPLARMLYRDVRSGSEIPAKFYKTVAKIIASIFRIEQMKKDRIERERREAMQRKATPYWGGQH